MGYSNVYSKLRLRKWVFSVSEEGDDIKAAELHKLW